MPRYLDQDVSEAYLQALIAAYRDGYRAAGGRTLDEDEAFVLAELEEHAIQTELGARELGGTQAKADAEDA